MRWLRQLINVLSGITLFGLIVGFLSGGKPVYAKRQDMVVFFHCKIPWKYASAMTFGDVVVVLHKDWATVDDMPPGLMEHEMKHAVQYNFTLGFPYFPLYWLACGYSWLVARDHYSYNFFESQAGLAAGGYLKKPRRRH